MKYLSKNAAIFNVASMIRTRSLGGSGKPIASRRRDGHNVYIAGLQNGRSVTGRILRNNAVVELPTMTLDSAYTMFFSSNASKYLSVSA
mmetsp:Transcript_16012/g.26276  ORF Transcript_16012/g.26276 Transcript_16012/m.26276 type:complete len:89 (-) Transcript_16012:115-381(-)